MQQAVPDTLLGKGVLKPTKHPKREKSSIWLSDTQGTSTPEHKCTNIRLKLQSTSSSKKRDRREINNKKEKSQNKVHSVLPPFKFPRLDQAWSWKKPWNFDSHQKKTWNSDSHHNCLIPESKTKIPESGQTSMDSSRDRAGKAKRTHLKSNGEQE